MEPMINKALKGAAVGAGIGLCWWVGKQIVPKRPTTRFEELNEDANAALAADSNVKGLCERMKQYQHLDKAAYATILLRWAELVHLQMQLQREEIPPRLSIPRTVSKKCSDIVESIRRLRALTAVRIKNNPQVMSDFDEIAGDFQKACNDYTHNLIKMVEYQQLR